MISKHLQLAVRTRIMHLDGHLRGTIVQESRSWQQFQRGLRALGITVTEADEAPAGDSLMVPVNDATRGDLIAALAAMPEESFSWFALACQASAMTKGGNAQIWPDGIGGFSAESRASIETVRKAVDAWLAHAQGGQASVKP